jgi:hypothetical protein
MVFYEVNLVVLVLLNVGLFYRQRMTSSTVVPKSSDDEELLKDFELEETAGEEIPLEPSSPGEDKLAASFVKQYLIGHLLAFAGDWLQVRTLCYNEWTFGSFQNHRHSCRADTLGFM